MCVSVLPVKPEQNSYFTQIEDETTNQMKNEKKKNDQQHILMCFRNKLLALMHITTSPEQSII